MIDSDVHQSEDVKRVGRCQRQGAHKKGKTHFRFLTFVYDLFHPMSESLDPTCVPWKGAQGDSHSCSCMDGHRYISERLPPCHSFLS